MAGSHTSSADGGRLGLAELIDVELCLRADRETPLAALLERDGEITARLDADALDDRALIGEWVRSVRGPDSLGRKVERLRGVLAFGLFAVGLVLGFGGVAAWLATGHDTPMNVVVFWPVVIGVPLLFVLGWLLAALPGALLDRLPGVAGLRELFVAVAGWLPTALGALFTRFGASDGKRALGELRRLALLYGRLRFWVLTGLTQAFALGFSLGATAALVGIPYVDDPAFGWRSRLMTASQLHDTVSVVALPWARLWPAALPTADQVDQTRYSSVDSRFVAGASPEGGPAVWAAWWPFLTASMLVYGLSLRVLTTIVSALGLRRALRRAPLDDVECRRLVARLRRSLDTRGETNGEPAPAGGDALGRASVRDLAGARVHAIRWAGVALEPAALCGEVSAATGAAGVAFGGEVGGLDPSGDETTIRTLPANAEPVAIVVDGWEWPVSDHCDFARALRDALGPNRAIWVLLRPPDDPPSNTLDVWRSRLGALGDPWLSVAELA